MTSTTAASSLVLKVIVRICEKGLFPFPKRVGERERKLVSERERDRERNQLDAPILSFVYPKNSHFWEQTNNVG